MVIHVRPQEETEVTEKKQPNLLCSQIPETGAMACHAVPYEKDTRVFRKQKIGAKGRFKSLPLLGFLQERQSRKSEQLSIG